MFKVLILTTMTLSIASSNKPKTRRLLTASYDWPADLTGHHYDGKVSWADDIDLDIAIPTTPEYYDADEQTNAQGQTIGEQHLLFR